MEPLRFTVALSFPGEHREFVSRVADQLSSTLSPDRVLYDKYHDEEFARLDLNTYLPALYRKDSQLIVIFLCPEYAAKLWCRLEWRHISQLIASVDAKRIMFLSFGNPGDLSDLGILSGDGYIDILPLTPEIVAEKIRKRLRLNEGITPPLTVPTVAPITNIRSDISRIIKYAPEELIGREAETKLLNDVWDKAVRGEAKRPHVLTFVALGGEGKTSLVAKWAADLAFQGWPGCDSVFAWSFYSQGTREQTAVSSDSFLAEALKFFGDEAMAGSAAGAFDKGRRLAQLVGERGALLILDGLEPLQYAPTSPTPGELKDAGIAALLKGLATTSHGLCIVTTRYAIADLRAYWQTTAPMQELSRLSTAAGVKLLRTIGVKTGSQAEFEKLVEDVDGHALTLQIIGQFLVRAFHGDIRRRERIDLQKADARIQGGHAFRAMEAYVKWLEDDSEEARREVALLKLLGLFDRPATADCIAALRQAPAIDGLTEPLVDLPDDDWEFSLTSLREAKLLTVNREVGSGELVALDAHPLLREYFALRVRQQQPEAWRAAHRRLYEHLCESTPDKPQPTLEDLQPLYQAVAHGCQAGLQQEACEHVYHARILGKYEQYTTHKLGVFGSDLGANSWFFDKPWSVVSPALGDIWQGWLTNQAAFCLRALGRLTEALEVMQAALRIGIEHEDWRNVAQGASNLSEFEITLGDVVAAARDAEQSVTYADRSGDAFMRTVTRSTVADALHQAGHRTEAETHFHEAEQIQADYPLLYSVRGFKYCELLLAAFERAAWQMMLKLETQKVELETSFESCRAVSQRAARTLKWVESWQRDLLSAALDHLTLGRAALYRAILTHSDFRLLSSEFSHLDAAVAGLRRAGVQDFLPHGLLTRAWLRFLTGMGTDVASAQEDLDEAWEIAERGPMRLHMADIHLYRARLFGGVKNDDGGMKYPWDKNPDGTPRGPKDDLCAARKLIEQCGYWRRKEELEDAEEAAKNW
jgi:tetratricopeptide (TPR) repeat protein